MTPKVKSVKVVMNNKMRNFLIYRRVPILRYRIKPKPNVKSSLLTTTCRKEYENR